jgi:predicted dehydrogenase
LTASEQPSVVKVGLIGCGTISPQYLKNLPGYPGVEVAVCSDIDMDRARSRAEEFGVPRSSSVAELLADTDVGLVINLTLPGTHAEVSLEAIAAGKHVYSEKPLAVAREDGDAVISAARKRGVMVGCAPDTFLGGGIQTCRRLIDEGQIGRPIAATAFMLNHGHEHWHPAPAFYYQKGAGPMFDMGPYYLTALIALLGPIRRVSGSHGSAFAERTITSEPLSGQTVEVEVPTHVAGVMDFQNGAIGTIVTSFDVWASQTPRIEIYGTEGTLSVPDPNRFGGPVMLQRGRDEWREAPLTHPEGGRGLGVAEMAAALRAGRESRVDAAMANHVLDVMHAVHESSDDGRHVTLRTSCERPAAVPPGQVEGDFSA